MRLQTYLTREKLSDAEFGQLINVQRVSVWRYRNGRIPTPPVIARIVKVTGGKVTAADLYAAGSLEVA